MTRLRMHGRLEKLKKSFQKLQPPLTWWHEMSKVEKNATVEVKVVKVDDEGGEFHTQVDTIPGLKKVNRNTKIRCTVCS